MPDSGWPFPVQAGVAPFSETNFLSSPPPEMPPGPVGAFDAAGRPIEIPSQPSRSEGGFRAQVPARVAANQLLERARRNELGADWQLLASRLAEQPVNALSSAEVAASPSTPPAAVAGNLTPASPLASSVALMALAAAGTHKIMPVDYDPFKMEKAAESEMPAQTVVKAPQIAAAAVGLPKPQTNLPPVRYVTKTGMRAVYSNPDLNLV